MTKKDEQQRPVAHILAANHPVYLTDECQFYTIVAGKRYAAASLNQLKSAVAKAVDDTTFTPDKLQLEPVDSAALNIDGKYEDSLRRAHVSITYEDDKDDKKHGLYQVTVRVEAQGRQDSKEFREASFALRKQIMEEVRRRLTGAEWTEKEKKRDDHYTLSSYWYNPRVKNRMKSSEIMNQLKGYLPMILEIDSTMDVDNPHSPQKAEIKITITNGQSFSIDVTENR